MAYIFISYASADRDLAAQVTGQLRAAGHQVFRDRDRDNGIKPGADWRQTLLRQLRICDAVVFLNSMLSQRSVWCHSELMLAVGLGKRVYPIDLSPELAPHELLQAVQGIAYDEDLDANVRLLIKTLIRDGLADAMPEWEHGRPPYPGLVAMDIPDAGVFFESAEFLGNLYGTPVTVSPAGSDVLLEIDLQGAQQVRRQRPDAVLILLKPPSPAVQEERLRARGDDEPHIARRLEEGAEEERMGIEIADAVVVNHDVTQATAHVAGIVERYRSAAH